MKIGLIDVDGKHFPNFALMKISAYHKSLKNDVEWYDGLSMYDIVYMSKIFTFSNDDYRVIQAKQIFKGGTGYSITSKLPKEIEGHNELDYSIYPMHNYSLQFYSRGCIRSCPFCVVSRKEGFITPGELHNINPVGKHIEVLDNNFFANPLWKSAVNYLISLKQPINLHGVDVRIMNEEQALWLNKLRIKGSINIAWDNPKDNILPMIKEMIKHVKPYKILCYILIGYWSTPEEDYERAIRLKELDIIPFAQPYRDFENKRIPSQYEKDFAGWVNKKERFKAFDFKEYIPRKGFCCSEYFK